jgi:hypothetical protein
MDRVNLPVRPSMGERIVPVSLSLRDPAAGWMP